ncbi:MAG: hypothetical protein ABUT39_07610 [Acidobacteriota bacterium]
MDRNPKQPDEEWNWTTDFQRLIEALANHSVEFVIIEIRRRSG